MNPKEIKRVEAFDLRDRPGPSLKIKGELIKTDVKDGAPDFIDAQVKLYLDSGYMISFLIPKEEVE